jgi:dipeptidyl aminopeptidase/acylaminoacyl peptidase
MSLDQIDRMVRQANPVPDLTVLEGVAVSDLPSDLQAKTELQSLDQLDIDLRLNDQQNDRRQTGRRRWRIIIAAAAVVLIVVGALVLSGGDDEESPAGPRPTDLQRVSAPPVANGLIAFVGESDDNPATSDIYVVNPDGTGLRPLTSTPELVEYAPAWSPAGDLVAFLRTSYGEFSLGSRCSPDCQLVVVDPSTGFEASSVVISEVTGVPQSVAWSPDGDAIAISSASCDGLGNCGPSTTAIADLETGTFTAFSPPSLATWSPDGAWLLVQDLSRVDASLRLIPADRLPLEGFVKIAELAGVRPLPSVTDGEWMPDGSAVLGTDGLWSQSDQRWIDVSIDIVNVADGERRTLIENGFDPIVSPDGTQIAYSRGETPSGSREVWVVSADGSHPLQVTMSSTPPVWSPDSSLLLVSDEHGWFTVRSDGTHRTTLGVRDHTPPFHFEGFIATRIDWQPVRADQQ